jgi:Uma2 family endonuclease
MHSRLLTLPEITAPVTLTFDPSQGMSGDAYYDFCLANPDLRIERSPQGKIIIVPPAGGESDNRSAKALLHLGNWAMKDGRGEFFGSSVEFMLPSGAAYSPDAAWLSNKRLSKLTKQQRRKFLSVCPEFVIEVMSPSDRLSAAKDKMLAWIAEGVELAWLIDADHETVYIYRTGTEKPEKRTGIDSLAGEGPVAGFVLDLKAIWAGL